MHGRIECRPHGLLARLAAAALRRLDDVQRRGAPAALLALTLAACALAPLAPLARGGQAGAAASAGARTAHEWPRTFDGLPLRPLGLSAVEQRFAAAFPGAIGRFTDGERLLVLRHVQRPTRMLHPAADCYRGLGYRIADARLERDRERRMWRCFEAARGSAGEATRLRVCERIADADGRAWTDTSAWFWAALMDRSAGPWQAVTTVTAVATVPSVAAVPSTATVAAFPTVTTGEP